MKTLRRITLSLLLVTTLSITVAAQNGGGCIPGDMNSPPCPGGNAQMVTNAEETTNAAATVTGPTVTTADVISEVAVDLVETLLAIF